ncbi:glycoside hydrolase family 31 protein [Laetiporus sulphureus 93-53]|uniref:beta-glucosidase n=1 Tax=Laetiporus sulphureus 93-53 TaxID=1314785 RepID=A0A165H3C5_9APHY|nr:glycoside hydrolase family 31 protein [Laetiporus sulphureus 93-53]KZT11187.1 glycoside hydrolase family 31 protein [Laetiporus sulphureus 93-53]
MGRVSHALIVFAALSCAYGQLVSESVLDACPGYKATNVLTNSSTLTANLLLAGVCNAFGPDIEQLLLEVTYETNTRIHVKITDQTSPRYEVPESVLPRPTANASTTSESALIGFNYTVSPFQFSIYRKSTSEVLFSTASYPLIYEPQYLRVKTSLPDNANIYGLGESTENFRLPTDNLTRTLWSRDAYGVPNGTNLYGNHPIYFEHRLTGTHGVFLLNSNGMDIKINTTEEDGTTLEYNVIGGVLDFYFLAGSETDPTEVVRQYAEVVGTPAEVPYWSFGLHQCRYGYTDFVEVAGVITNYSLAEIPLETMWTDIDYMYNRRIFTVDPDYFPLPRMREIIDYLHTHDQHYILMNDPAIAYAPDEGYRTFDRGSTDDVWLKAENGSYFLGVVWPGVTVFPDWFSPLAQYFWTNEFQLFYNPENGLDIDGAWIDMNEPSSFCVFPCNDPFAQAREGDDPPARTTLPPDPNTPIFVNSSSDTLLTKRQYDSRENVLNPPYMIQNAAGVLSDKTAYTNAKHANGLIEYDTHNLFGTMMSAVTHNAMLARRPGLRTLVVTRSTFAGAGTKVQKWLGDNLSDWEHYQNSIAGILSMASIFHVPMVGADICGYADNTTEPLCARWAMLGAFYPFMRNHNTVGTINQEFYRWPTVAQAAKNALDMRYRLMDYIYTAFHQDHLDGTPILHPLWYKYPQDENTFGIDLQFLYGDFILVSPVTEENATSVSIYLPDDVFYDFLTYEPVQGNASYVEVHNVNLTSISIHIRGGAVLPLRAQGAMTTTALRKENFDLVVAPGFNGEAWGTLYMDDGVSITPNATTEVSMAYKNGTLTVAGTFGYETCVNVSSVLFLGIDKAPGSVQVNGQDAVSGTHDSVRKVFTVPINLPFDQDFSVKLY